MAVCTFFSGEYQIGILVGNRITENLHSVGDESKILRCVVQEYLEAIHESGNRRVDGDRDAFGVHGYHNIGDYHPPGAVHDTVDLRACKTFEQAFEAVDTLVVGWCWIYEARDVSG